RSRGTQNEPQAVVALVARVLVNRTFPLPHENLARPASRPRRRVVECELVEDRIGVDACETLEHPQLLAGENVLARSRRRTAKVRSVCEIRRLDHKGVAFPVAAPIAALQVDVRAD